MENKNGNKIKRLNKKIGKIQHRRDVIMALLQIVSAERRKGTVTLSQQEMIRHVLNPVDDIFLSELRLLKREANDLYLNKEQNDVGN